MGRTAGDEFGRSFGDRASGQARQTGQRITSALTPSLSNVGKSFLGAAGGAARFATSLVSVAGAGSVAAGGLGVAVQGALSLAAALAPASGALLALPAVVVGAAGALTVLKLAVGGLGAAWEAALAGNEEAFNKAITGMAPAAVDFAIALRDQAVPAVNELKQAVASSFLSPLLDDVTGLSAVLRGPLQGSLAGLGATFGAIASDVAEFVQYSSTVRTLVRIYDDLRAAIETVRPAVVPLLDAFLRLSQVGGSFLSGFAPAVRDSALRLAELTVGFVESGAALESLQNGFGVLGQLWQLLKDLGGIASAVFGAIRETGGSALGVLGSLVGGLRAFLESAEGQAILVAIFDALGRVGAALLPVVSALASGIGLLAPIIGRLAEIIGPILTTALTALGPALATVGGSLVTVFQQFGVAVQILADSGALQSIANALAALLVAVAPILPPLAQLISLLAQGLAFVITTYVAPALSTLVGWISTAVNWLTGAGLSEDSWLSRAIMFIYETAMPVWQQIYTQIETVIADIKTWLQENQGTFEEWGAKLQSIISRVGEVASGIWEFIAWAWDNFGGPLLNIVGGVFTGILGVVDGVLQALSGVIEFILGVITGDWERAWEGIKSFTEGLWNGIVAIAETIWNSLIELLKGIFDAFGLDWEDTWNSVATFFEDIWNGLVDWISDRVDDIGKILDWFGELPDMFSDWFGRVKDSVVKKFNETLDWIRDVPGKIKGFFSDAGSWLYNAGREIVNGLWNGIVSLWNWVVGQWDNMVDGLIKTVKNILGIASPSRVFMEIGRFIGQGLAKGITGTSALVGNAVSGLADHVTSAWSATELPLALDPDRLNGAAAWGGPTAVSRLPAQTQPAGSALVTAGASAERVYHVTLNAAPNLPSERQIVNALSYADALYA
ncbi:phage tail protein [Nonomuraea rubra]|uniref:phage tail protein n=1 Tax=Nonomuraea rubra TaxID=46180 RepID=UPI0033D0842D